MTEAEFRAALSAAGLAGDDASVSRWSNAPGDRYSAHRHDYDKVLVADSGSIAFALPELSWTADLSAGDRLDLPAGTLHSATVGPDGVTCFEAHFPAGVLPAETAGTRRA